MNKPGAELFLAFARAQYSWSACLRCVVLGAGRLRRFGSMRFSPGGGLNTAIAAYIFHPLFIVREFFGAQCKNIRSVAKPASLLPWLGDAMFTFPSCA